ncbi:MAG: hypothetical protein HY820_13530 [Acidobacteria bacterium]|nr:hypothetical protein [Acidobacteriota bacterium]
MSISLPVLPARFLWIAMAVLAVIVVGIYFQTWQHDFVNLDDRQYITDNPNVRTGFSLTNLRWAFVTVEHYYWQPLTWISHMLDCQLFGLNAGPHHLVSTGIHALNGALLAWTLFLLTGSVGRSIFAAALFALHPLRVESVAWAAERKDLLSGLFWILTVAAYAYYAKSPSWKRYLPVVLAALCAAMSKPTVVTLPFVLLLLDFWPLARLNRLSQLWPRIYEKIPLFLISAGLSVITYIGQSAAGATVDLGRLPASYRLKNAIVSYGDYLAKIFWPAKLSVFYPLHKIDTLTLVMTVVLLLAVTAFALKWSSTQGYAVTGWFWFLGAMVPMVGLAQSGLQAMADRFSYIPSIGISIFASWLAVDLTARFVREWKIPKWKIAGAAAALICIVLAFLSFRQTALWKDSYTIFEHSIAVTDDNDFLHMTLAEMYHLNGQLPQASKHVEQAIRIEPNNTTALWLAVQINLASAKLDVALGYARRVVRLLPREQKLPRRTLALLLWQNGKAAEALTELDALLREDPNDAESQALRLMMNPTAH